MEGNVEQRDDGIYSFRLFAKKATSKHAASTEAYQTINLRSPTPPDTSPGFVDQHRPATYYFTGLPAGKITEQYQRTALTGEDVIQYRQAKWPGSELSWRVTTIDVTEAKNPSATPRRGDDTAGKKKRRGKKRRMIVRAKFVAKEVEVLAARQALADKEVAWKEKRARANRKNKLKKKEKDRLDKA